ncbi:hypothetical protein [Candidatus Thiosymbion oneisti]|uniref:hypothetical protein n=1 Tax=Candidatus Thiosymbion oneisti TaxID=589554 RepID=UPI00105B3A87|nr:hypothetical protein [Candidatus Thiosymbion oneisti]
MSMPLPGDKKEEKLRITRIGANGFTPIRRFLFRILIDHDQRSAANFLISLGQIPRRLRREKRLPSN